MHLNSGAIQQQFFLYIQQFEKNHLIYVESMGKNSELKIEE